MEHPKISVIVPVYNAENYLHRCVDSILAQTFTDFEVLLINDGSTDKSGGICDEYALKDKRFRVFHKDNGGVSSARNLAIENVSGEWVTFLDSDDILPPSSIKSMVEAIQQAKADFYIFNYLYDETSVKEALEDIISQEELIKGLLTYRINTAPWAKLYKTSYLKSIRFNTSLQIGEDLLFCFEYAMQIGKKMRVKHDCNEVYQYLCRQDSVMRSKGVKEKLLKLNDIAIPIIKKYLDTSFNEELIFFEAHNLFTSHFMSCTYPSKKEDVRMSELGKSLSIRYKVKLKYLLFLSISRCLAHLLLCYLYTIRNFRR